MENFTPIYRVDTPFFLVKRIYKLVSKWVYLLIKVNKIYKLN